MGDRRNDPNVSDRLKAVDELLAGFTPEQQAAFGANLDKGEHARRKTLEYAAEMAKRQMDALRLYVPTKIQDNYHACLAKECMFQAGNQVGKSLAGFAEIARAVRGEDPYDKYPKRDGVCAIVGYKERHIGLVVHKYLFRAGAFKIIRDSDSQQWRVWRPWVPQDMERMREARPAPPLVPNRFIDRIAWTKKSEHIFSQAWMKNGWVIYAFSSNSKPDQGFQVDLAHIDEDIINEDWYTELAGRTTMRNGKLRWTALPHNENDVMNSVAERAEDEAMEHERGGPVPQTVVIHATVFDNPFMPNEAREANIKIWKGKGDEEYRKRALGERITDTVRMYPNFCRPLHAVAEYKGKICKEIDRYLITKEIPDNWCLDAVVDPGHTTCAALFCATPPPEIGNFKLLFKQLYIKQCDAKRLAKDFHEVVKSRWYQRWIIDAHGGSLTSFDTGRKPQEAYEEELRMLKTECVATGCNFQRGCDAIQFREECLRGWLNIQRVGYPTLLYDHEECVDFEREMIRFKKLKIGELITDKGNRRANTHLVECAEYFAADELEYVPPIAKKVELSPAQAWLKNFKMRQSERKAKSRGFAKSNVLLGPQGSK